MFTSNSNISKLAFKVLIFVIVMSVPIAFTEYSLRHNGNTKFLSYKYKYDEIINNKTKSDIIIIGSSHGNHGINPRVISFKDHSIYNFCFDGGAPSFNYDLYTNVISNHYKKPKLIIYEVSSLTFDKNRLNRTLESDCKYMPIGFDYTRNKPNIITTPFNFLCITHESDVYRALVDSFKSKKADDVLIDQYNNGFVPLPENFKIADRPKTEISNNEIEKFESFIKLITSQGIAVIFVETPDYSPEIKDITTVNTVNDLLCNFAAKYSIPFLNYNRDLKSNLNNNKRYFFDQDHLNVTGARFFSEALSRDLNTLLKSNIIKLPRN